jgi:uncharacterized membrane protein YoaK (UPF0700 family)
MLITQGSARDEKTDRRLAAALAAVAGAINGAAFQAVGFFAANMTGNVSLLSNRLALGQLSAASFYGEIVAIFVVGAATSTLLMSAGYRRGSRIIFALTVLVEGILMGVLGTAEVLMPGERSMAALVLGSSFLMGWQNAVVTRISEARVRTTHVSGMITDIGIEIALGLEGAIGRIVPDDRNTNIAKLRLHLWTVGAFLAGGSIGVMLFQRIHGYLYVLTAVALVGLSLAELRRARRLMSSEATPRAS